MRLPTVALLLVSVAVPFAVFVGCSDDTKVGGSDAGSNSDTGSKADTGSSADGSSPEGGGTLVERGAALVVDNGCHGCHSTAKGVMAGNAAGLSHKPKTGDAFTIYPKNLTPDPDTGIGTAADGWSDAQLARAIRTGIDDECLTLCSAMPRFASLTDAEVTAIIAYLRSLPAVKNEVPDVACPSLTPATGAGGDPVPDAGDCPVEETDAGATDGSSDAAKGG